MGGDSGWRPDPAHLPEYAIEAALLAVFMFSACSFGVLLEHPSSPVHRALPSDHLRRALMGAAMGLTAVGVIYSPWGGRSGAHINPATTLTFWRLGRMRRGDVLGYLVGQFLGAVTGVMLAHATFGAWLSHPSVNFVVTSPGGWGAPAAFVAELAMTALLMGVVVTLSGSRHARHTGLAVGVLVALYITFEAPVSGMSMNPARTFGSALAAMHWRVYWLYVLAPVLGMNLGAAIATALRAGAACPKLHHPASQRCIFCGHTPERTSRLLASLEAPRP